jgi:hypothetical protein
LALKHVGAINTEQYNKLSINCAMVCSLYIWYKDTQYTGKITELTNLHMMSGNTEIF